ncbi:MAG: hypothetical protein H7Z71_01615 [Moraxellaceae bacterium]|nr:hypothetical protein [Pseudobdellovibrionaceae bacterium]
MKSMILTAVLLVGFSVSAQSVCQVSSDTAQSIDSINNSNMMAKPKANVIRAMVGADECVAQYLQNSDAALLARAIIDLKGVSAVQILTNYVDQAEAKLRSLDLKTCQPASETVEKVEQIARLRLHAKARYVTIKGLLGDDECLSAELSPTQIKVLSQRITFETADSLAIQSMISEALAL